MRIMTGSAATPMGLLRVCLAQGAPLGVAKKLDDGLPTHQAGAQLPVDPLSRFLVVLRAQVW